ncbi:hypothetical protein J0656_19520 [Muricauda ruestringensis]|uniref:Response regulatory domain-containing protein n=1 Tax=Flagellimonas aurea TaxID=2915619 RepID=A0ABS3GBI5_9FLAO|nr:hypothetical protein [Allomuricauda aurea]MBO0356216.1 hypothetical protein [Allomuricauda aurea]
MEPLKILVIHDDLFENDPLLYTLRERFGRDNVILEKKSSQGLEYIYNNLSSKLIVLLDFDLGAGEPHAPEVFKRIREKTSLIYVIIYTAKQFTAIPNEALIDFINNEALGIIQSTADIPEVVGMVEKAAHQLDTRVDCILEQWIAKHSEKERAKPYLTTKSGTIYTLDDLIVEIRKETELGQQLEKSILQLAIELLTSQKRQLDD